MLISISITFFPSLTATAGTPTLLTLTLTTNSLSTSGPLRITK